jgi:predicted CopG family antitoxin
MTNKTTIKISMDVKERLSKERKFEKETYDNILRRLVGMRDFTVVNPKFSASITISDFDPEDIGYQALMEDIGNVEMVEGKTIEGYWFVDSEQEKVNRHAKKKINGVDTTVTIDEDGICIHFDSKTQEELETKIKAITERYNGEVWIGRWTELRSILFLVLFFPIPSSLKSSLNNKPHPVRITVAVSIWKR